jgi:hypothetical protein
MRIYTQNDVNQAHKEAGFSDCNRQILNGLLQFEGTSGPSDHPSVLADELHYFAYVEGCRL